MRVCRLHQAVTTPRVPLLTPDAGGTSSSFVTTETVHAAVHPRNASRHPAGKPAAYPLADTQATLLVKAQSDAYGNFMREGGPVGI